MTSGAGTTLRVFCRRAGIAATRANASATSSLISADQPCAPFDYCYLSVNRARSLIKPNFHLSSIELLDAAENGLPRSFMCHAEPTRRDVPQRPLATFGQGTRI